MLRATLQREVLVGIQMGMWQCTVSAHDSILRSPPKEGVKDPLGSPDVATINAFVVFIVVLSFTMRTPWTSLHYVIPVHPNFRFETSPNWNWWYDIQMATLIKIVRIIFNTFNMYLVWHFLCTLLSADIHRMRMAHSHITLPFFPYHIMHNVHTFFPPTASNREHTHELLLKEKFLGNLIPIGGTNPREQIIITPVVSSLHSRSHYS